MALGTCIGKLTHTGKFRLTIGALDLISQYAKYKVRTVVEIAVDRMRALALKSAGGKLRRPGALWCVWRDESPLSAHGAWAYWTYFGDV